MWMGAILACETSRARASGTSLLDNNPQSWQIPHGVSEHPHSLKVQIHTLVFLNTPILSKSDESVPFVQ